MKICLINNLYKPFARGGAERIVELTARGLKESGHEVFIISTSPEWTHEIFTDGIKTHFLSSMYYNLNKMPKTLRWFWHFYDTFDIITYLRTLRILKKEKPSIVITHNLKGISYLLPFLFKKLKIKHIHVLHDIQLIHPSGLMFYGKEEEIKSIFYFIYSRMCSLLFNSPDIVISPSKWLMDMHIRLGFFRNSEKKIIPNPVSFKKTLIKKGNNSNVVINFLYVGQIERHKGIFLLLDAFNEVLRCGLNANLIIVGAGGCDKILIENIQDERIKFLGRKNEDEIMDLMRNSDCLAVPSLCYENSPTVIYEAAISELFVLASNLGGISELMKNFRGVMFKPKKNDLVEKLKIIIKNPETVKIAPGSLRKNIEKFSLNRYIKLLNNLFL